MTPSGHLLLKGVPYVTQRKEVARGILVSGLELEMNPDGEVTKKPQDHVVRFIGETPCDHNGNPLVSLIIGKTRIDIGGGIMIDFEFSRAIRGGNGYRDYFHKMTTYVNTLSKHARKIETSVTATIISD